MQQVCCTTLYPPSDTYTGSKIFNESAADAKREYRVPASERTAIGNWWRHCFGFVSLVRTFLSWTPRPVGGGRNVLPATAIIIIAQIMFFHRKPSYRTSNIKPSHCIIPRTILTTAKRFTKPQNVTRYIIPQNHRIVSQTVGSYRNALYHTANIIPQTM